MSRHPASLLVALAFALSASLATGSLCACAAGGQGRIHAPPGDTMKDGGDSGETSEAEGAAPEVRYDEPFELALHHSARVEHGDVLVRFAELIEDSRCPRDVECIQAGRARVRLEVRRGAAEPVSIEIGTDADRALASAGGVTWELQAVSPYPTASGTRDRTQTTLTLVARPLRTR